MPIDYSKWDKIEISDDSDVEVHPNVDKTSFIRWKQRDIHEKRAQRNIEIKSILVQLTMYVKLNERVDLLLKDLTDSQLLDNDLILSTINANFDPKERFDYEALKKSKGDELRKGLRDLQFDREEIENTPPYNEMIEDLFIQIKEDHAEAKNDGAKIREYVKEHRAKIDDVLSKSSIKLDDLLYQKSMLITNEDLHTGFDKTFLNKSVDEEEEVAAKKPESVEKAATTVKPTEAKSTPAPPLVPATTSKPTASKTPSGETTSSAVTPSAPVAAAPASTASSTSSTAGAGDIEDELTILPDTLEFSKIPASNIQASAEYLVRHTKICTEQQKDALLMSAFDSQLSGDSVTTQQVIHQSLLLQYIAQLSGPRPTKDQTIKAIKLFCSKVSDRSTPAAAGFQQDVLNTFNHIKQRCEIIKAEHAQELEGEGEAQIQLKALDDDTEISVNLPEPNTKEYDIFTKDIPVPMQEAVKTGSLDEVNKVFATLPVEEAERILELFDQCGVIGINAYLEDENDFKQLQEQYNENLVLEEQKQQQQHAHAQVEQEFNTVDEVD